MINLGKCMPIQDSSPARRNLIVTSLAFIVYFTAGGQFDDNKISFGLVNITFDKPIVLAVFAWLMLFWFVIRFHQENRLPYQTQRETDIQSGSRSKLLNWYVTRRTGLKLNAPEGFTSAFISPINDNAVFVHRRAGGAIDEDGELLFHNETSAGERVAFTGALGYLVKFYCYLKTYIQESGFGSTILPYILFWLAVTIPIIQLICTQIKALSFT